MGAPLLLFFRIILLLFFRLRHEFWQILGVWIYFLISTATPSQYGVVSLEFMESAAGAEKNRYF